MKFVSVSQLLLFFICSCSSNVRLPLTSFESSENRGMGSSDLQFNISKAARLKSAQDYRATPLINTGTQDSTLGYGLNGGLGLADFVDLTWKYNVSGPFFAGAKLGLWGDPMNKAKAINFSLAVRYSYGIYITSDEIEGSEVQADPANKVSRQYLVEFGSSELEALVGFRVMDMLQLTLGYLKGEYSLHNSFSKGISDEKTIDGKRKLIHLLTTANFGPFLAQLDLGKSDLTNTEESQKIDEFLYGLSFGLFF
ncbi:MAG: hypothetical protein Fur0010_02780 [Bdellovibrio sp.]